MNKSIIFFIILISAQYSTAQILSFSPLIGGKMECARFTIYYDAPEFSPIKVDAPLFRPMRSVLFGGTLNYEFKRSMFSAGIILNEQVKTTMSYEFPAILDGESVQYSKKLNLGEKLLKIPITYRLILLKNDGNYSRLSLMTGLNFIFYTSKNQGPVILGEPEIFTLDNGTGANNLMVQTNRFVVNQDKFKMSLELGLSYTFKIGEKHRIISSLNYEQGLMALLSNEIRFTGSDGSRLSYYNSARGSSVHLKFAYPINLNFTK
jgi:hypothetical protein